MRRREFLATIVAVPLAAIVPTTPTPEPTRAPFNYHLYPAQEAFFYGGNRGGGKSYRFEGIPYHYNDGTTGTWLGLSRG